MIDTQIPNFYDSTNKIFEDVNKKKIIIKEPIKDKKNSYNNYQRNTYWVFGKNPLSIQKKIKK